MGEVVVPKRNRIRVTQGDGRNLGGRPGPDSGQAHQVCPGERGGQRHHPLQGCGARCGRLDDRKTPAFDSEPMHRPIWRGQQPPRRRRQQKAGVSRRRLAERPNQARVGCPRLDTRHLLFQDGRE